MKLIRHRHVDGKLTKVGSGSSQSGGRGSKYRSEIGNPEIFFTKLIPRLCLKLVYDFFFPHSVQFSLIIILDEMKKTVYAAYFEN